MADEPPTHEQSARSHSGAPEYDNWPLQTTDDDNRYIGVAGVEERETPLVYHTTDHTVYEGRPDEESEQIIVDEGSSREFDEETTLTEIIHAIGDDMGWTTLSEWAHRQASTDPGEIDHVEFQKQNVLDEADHEYGFYGSYTFTDDTDRVHTVERQFRVYTDPDNRVDGNPTIDVEETHLVADPPQEERRAGDATIIGQTTTQLIPDLSGNEATAHEESSIHEWCLEWHESHLHHPPTRQK